MVHTSELSLTIDFKNLFYVSNHIPKKIFIFTKIFIHLAE